METLQAAALSQVGGGKMLFTADSSAIADGGFGSFAYDYGGSPGYYETTATYADAAQARTDLATYNDVSGWVSAAAGIGAGALVTGACIGVPALLSGPAAVEVAAIASRPCAYLGSLAGTATGIWVSGILKRGAEGL